MKLDVIEATVGMRFGALLDWLAAVRGISERRRRIDVVQRAVAHADPGVLTDGQRQRAIDLGVPERVFGDADFRLPDHAVRVPFVLPGLGQAVVRHMQVAADPTMHGGYDLRFEADAADAIFRAMSAAFERARVQHPGARYRLTTSHPLAFASAPQGVAVRGPSLGAAAFVSAYALSTRRRVLPGVVVTGAIVGDAVRHVGGLGAKLAAIVDGRADIERIVVPAASATRARTTLHAGLGPDSRLQVIGVHDVEELIEATLAPGGNRLPIRHRVSEVRRDFDTGWRDYGWYGIRDHIERVAEEVPAHCPDLRIDVLSMLGAAQAHLGALDESLALLEEAERYAALPEIRQSVPDFVQTRLQQRIAMTCRSLGRQKQAGTAARRAIAAAKRGRMRDERFKSHGCAGLVALSSGALVRAVDQFEQASAHVHAYAPESCVRSHAYLVEAHGRAGDLRAARREYRLGREHFAAQPDASQRPVEDAWLRLSMAGALLSAGRHGEALELLSADCVRSVIERTPIPGQLARRRLGLALAGSGRAHGAYRLLEPSLYAYGSPPTAGLLLLAQLNVLCEAQARLQQGDWSSDIEGRLEVTLRRLPPHAVGVAGSALVARLRSQLGGSARIERPLSKLITRLERIA